MYYELYVDVLFLINMCMSFFIFAIIKKLLGCTATYLRIFLVSVISSVLTILIIVLPIKSIILKYAVIHLGINLISIKLALRIKDRFNFVKAILLLYTLTFFFGGAIAWMTYGTTVHPEQILLGGFVLFVLIRGAINIYSYYKRNLSKVCEVTLFLNSKQLKLNGLIDTGNSLLEPISRKPVNIIPFHVLRGLLDPMKSDLLLHYLEYGIGESDEIINDLDGICYVPYCSVGKTNGLLPAIRIEKMEIVYDEKKKEIVKPIIGICQDEFMSDKKYQIILNPNLME